MSLALLYCTIREPQLIQFFILVFLKILNVPIRSVFQNQVKIVEHMNNFCPFTICHTHTLAINVFMRIKQCIYVSNVANLIHTIDLLYYISNFYIINFQVKIFLYFFQKYFK